MYVESAALIQLDNGEWVKGIKLYRSQTDPDFMVQLLAVPDRGVPPSMVTKVPWQRIEMMQSPVAKVILGVVPGDFPRGDGTHWRVKGTKVDENRKLTGLAVQLMNGDQNVGDRVVKPVEEFHSEQRFSVVPPWEVVFDMQLNNPSVAAPSSAPLSPSYDLSDTFRNVFVVFTSSASDQAQEEAVGSEELGVASVIRAAAGRASC